MEDVSVGHAINTALQLAPGERVPHISDEEAASIVRAANATRDNDGTRIAATRELDSLVSLINSQRLGNPQSPAAFSVTPAAAQRLGVCLRSLPNTGRCR